jgi:hypothetical protein
MERNTTMRKLIISGLIVGLLAGAVVAPAEAKKKKKPKLPQKIERVVEGTYDNPAIGVPGVVGTSSAGGAVEFPIGAEEAYVSIDITDGSGQPVIATLSQDTDPSTPSWEIFATICGKTEAPLVVSPGIPVRVSVYTVPGPDQPNCTGPATGGKIKATFSNMP